MAQCLVILLPRRHNVQCFHYSLLLIVIKENDFQTLSHNAYETSQFSRTVPEILKIWCQWWELNPHGFLQKFLRLSRLRLRHTDIVIDLVK
jgi:hypothetical protein